MLFTLWTSESQRNHVLDGGSGYLYGRANFGDVVYQHSSSNERVQSSLSPDVTNSTQQGRPAAAMPMRAVLLML